jgi:flagellar motor switch protein FliG
MEALRSMPAPILQARLLNTKDCDLAVVLTMLSEQEREEIYKVVSQSKADRLRREVERMRHIHLAAATTAKITSH